MKIDMKRLFISISRRFIFLVDEIIRIKYILNEENRGAWKLLHLRSGVPRNFVRWGGGSTNSVEDRGQRKRSLGAVGP